jgi:hypothetical protein
MASVKQKKLIMSKQVGIEKSRDYQNFKAKKKNLN